VGLVEEAVAAGDDPAGALRERFQAAETALLRPDGAPTAAADADALRSTTVDGAAAADGDDEDEDGDEDDGLWRQVQRHLVADSTKQQRDWAGWYEDSEISDVFVRYLRYCLATPSCSCSCA
jgi:hypothetical protein